MTKQITVKLNSELFSPIINSIQKYEDKGCSKTNSECVGKMLFLVHQMLYKKYPKCDNMTKLEIMTKGLNMSLEEQFVEFHHEYAEFLKSGKCW